MTRQEGKDTETYNSRLVAAASKLSTALSLDSESLNQGDQLLGVTAFGVLGRLVVYLAVILGMLWASCVFFPGWFPGWQGVQVSTSPGTASRLVHMMYYLQRCSDAFFRTCHKTRVLFAICGQSQCVNVCIGKQMYGRQNVAFILICT